MKKVLPILLCVMLLMPVVYAEETIATEETIGIDSPLWRLDRAMERIQLRLTRNAEKRTELRLKIMNERLNEIDWAQKKIDKVDERLAKKINKALEDVDDQTAAIEDDISEGKVRATERIREQLENRRQELERIRERAMLKAESPQLGQQLQERMQESIQKNEASSQRVREMKQQGKAGK